MERITPLARLWRTIMKRPMGAHKRTQVVPAHAADVQGECVGLSQSVARKVYCSDCTPDNIALVRMMKGTLPDHLREFSFSTTQLNRGLRPIVHRD